MPAHPNDLYSMTILVQVNFYYASLSVRPFIGQANRFSDMMSLLIK